jgi:hypothetical protein
MLSMKKLRDAGVSEMARYDIVFVGHTATGHIFPFQEPAHMESRVVSTLCGNDFCHFKQQISSN